MSRSPVTGIGSDAGVVTGRRLSGQITSISIVTDVNPQRHPRDRSGDDSGHVAEHVDDLADGDLSLTQHRDVGAAAVHDGGQDRGDDEARVEEYLGVLLKVADRLAAFHDAARHPARGGGEQRARPAQQLDGDFLIGHADLDAPLVPAYVPAQRRRGWHDHGERPWPERVGQLPRVIWRLHRYSVEYLLVADQHLERRRLAYRLGRPNLGRWSSTERVTSQGVGTVGRP